jgi:hypothetical protein
VPCQRPWPRVKGCETVILHPQAQKSKGNTVYICTHTIMTNREWTPNFLRIFFYQKTPKKVESNIQPQRAMSKQQQQARLGDVAFGKMEKVVSIMHQCVYVCCEEIIRVCETKWFGGHKQHCFPTFSIRFPHSNTRMCVCVCFVHIQHIHSTRSYSP